MCLVSFRAAARCPSVILFDIDPATSPKHRRYFVPASTFPPQFLKPVAGLRQPPADRGFLASENRRDLGRGKVFQVAQHQHRAIPVRQLIHDGADFLPQFLVSLLAPVLIFAVIAWIDLPVAVSTQRLANARNPDRFEKESADFFDRIRNAYLARAEQFPQRFRVIDSGKTIPQIQAELQAILAGL